MRERCEKNLFKMKKKERKKTLKESWKKCLLENIYLRRRKAIKRESSEW
jgi:hypothetical protein